VAREAVTLAIRARMQTRTPQQPACRLRLLDVAVSMPPEADNLNAPWAERWTLEACGEAVRAVVNYGPNGRGGFGVTVPPRTLTISSAGPVE
jgi:hypothetical protein